MRYAIIAAAMALSLSAGAAHAQETMSCGSVARTAKAAAEGKVFGMDKAMIASRINMRPGTWQEAILDELFSPDRPAGLTIDTFAARWFEICRRRALGL